MKHGFGRFSWTNSNVYSGQWQQNKMWGHGCFQFSNGNVFIGTFVADNKDGIGKFTWSNGDTYEGCWAKDEMNGAGTTRYANGNVYSGEHMSNLKHGKGQMEWASGDKFDGEWRKGMIEGCGSFLYSDGGKYTGEWHQDRRHGQGSMLHANGDQYKGAWANDMRHGDGTCEYANSDTFVGCFVDNLRQGWGVYTAASMRVLNPDGQSGVLPSGFDYLIATDPKPILAGITPTTGPEEGGSPVILTGDNFTGGGLGFVGYRPLSSWAVLNSSIATGTTQPVPAGFADVVITNGDGQSVRLENAFEFIGAPTIDSFDPTIGPVAGGTLVVLAGKNFVSGARVYFGGVESQTERARRPYREPAGETAHHESAEEQELGDQPGPDAVRPQRRNRQQDRAAELEPAVDGADVVVGEGSRERQADPTPQLRRRREEGQGDGDERRIP